MSVPVSPHTIRAVRKMVESFVADRGFSVAKVSDLSLAVAEALFNAMEHGNQVGRPIRVEVAYHGDRVEVAVEDHGNGEDEQWVERMRAALDEEQPELTPEFDLERGRGLYLIKARSDQVSVERLPDAGVRIVMVKRK